MARMKIGVLISGRGSNLQSLIDACATEDYPARIVLVISNRQQAKGLERARQAGIDTLVVDHGEYDSRAAFEQALHAALADAGVELVCLAGFMRLLDADFIAKWRNRIVNIHPSLLPAYRGLRTHERVIEDGVRFTGCTVHYVRPEMDEGPIIMQAVVPVKLDDTPESLARRVLAYEHRIYPEAVRLIATGRARVSSSRVVLKQLTAPEDGIISPVPKPEAG